MAILSGRFGQVAWDPTGGATPVALVAISDFKLSLKTNYEDVTCFGDTNMVYVPGMRDVSGSLNGFWDSADTSIFWATEATAPGMLELTPNMNEPTFLFKGLAYLDAELDCTVKGAPKVVSTFKAGGPWTQEPPQGTKKAAA
jgi:hypothetical protein